MKINLLQISNSDLIGGAARVAWDLHRSYNAGDEVHSKLVVGQKLSNDPATEEIDNHPSGNIIQKGLDQAADALYEKQIRLGRYQLSGPLRRLAHPKTYLLDSLGIDNYDQPGSRKIFHSLVNPPDVVHLHNLHINYFDLNLLPAISHKTPTLFTLHDCWTFTGHCAYYLDCNGWQNDCPACPYLSSYPPIQKDNAAFNFRRKKKIYENSKLSIVTPSKWLMNDAEKSILAPAIQQKAVIYNGVDQSIFHPRPKDQLRRELNIPENDFVLLFVANNAKDNVYKDYHTINNAIEILAQSDLQKPVSFICIGSTADPVHMGNINIRYIPFTKDSNLIAKYYAAANIYLHAARADNCPLVILEALSSGVPVIATAVGGIPELINENESGYLVPSGDSRKMAERIIHLLNHPDKLQQMENMAVTDAQRRFSLQNMMTEYIRFYETMMEKAGN